MTTRQTLVLDRARIAATVSMADYVLAVEEAFRRHGSGGMRVPAVVHIPAQAGAFHVKSAGYDGAPGYVAVKVNGNFPDNPRTHGLPTIQGAIVLCDGANGSLLAVMDSIEVTAMRTAAATAVAAKYLAPQGVHVATIIGCGVQARPQLLALREVLSLDTVYAFDIDVDRRDAFVAEMRSEQTLDVRPIDEIAVGTWASQLIVTCTSSRTPFLGPSHVRPGTFIAAVGADNDDKQELEPALLRGARVAVDDLAQCAKIGELHHALDAGVMTVDDVCAELGAIVAGGKRPEFDRNDIVVFDSTGSAIQDVAAAGMIYDRARAGGSGFAIAFGGHEQGGDEPE